MLTDSKAGSLPFRPLDEHFPAIASWLVVLSFFTWSAVSTIPCREYALQPFLPINYALVSLRRSQRLTIRRGPLLPRLRRDDCLLFICVRRGRKSRDQGSGLRMACQRRARLAACYCCTAGGIVARQSADHVRTEHGKQREEKAAGESRVQRARCHEQCTESTLGRQHQEVAITKDL